MVEISSVSGLQSIIFEPSSVAFIDLIRPVETPESEIGHCVNSYNFTASMEAQERTDIINPVVRVESKSSEVFLWTKYPAIE